MDMVLHSLVIWLLLFSYADADIKIFSNEIAMECGSKCTLTCKTKPFTSSVAWMFQNDVIPIAKCNKRICNILPKYVEHYDFTPDVEKGIFNLTIKKLTKSDIGRTFVCSKGDESASETIRLKDYKVLRLEDTENNIITATFGYISPDTNVMFKWTKIDADDNQESGFRPQLLYTDAKLFSNVSVCITDQQMQHSVIISAKPSLSGRYYMKIAVTYGNESVVSNITTLKYNIEEQDLSNKESDAPKEQVLTPVVIILVVCIVTQTTIFIVFVFWIRKQRSVVLSTSSYSSVPLIPETPNSDKEVPELSEERIIMEMQRIQRGDLGYVYTLQCEESEKTRAYTFRFLKEQDIFAEEETYLSLVEEPDLSDEEETDQ